MASVEDVTPEPFGSGWEMLGTVSPMEVRQARMRSLVAALSANDHGRDMVAMSWTLWLQAPPEEIDRQLVEAGITRAELFDLYLYQQGYRLLDTEPDRYPVIIASLQAALYVPRSRSW